MNERLKDYRAQLRCPECSTHYNMFKISRWQIDHLNSCCFYNIGIVLGPVIKDYIPQFPDDPAARVEEFRHKADREGISDDESHEIDLLSTDK